MQHLQAAPRRLHVLLVASQPLERVGIRSILTDLDVVEEVTEASTEAEAAAALRRSKPTMAVVNLLPGTADPVRQMRALTDGLTTPRLPILAIGEHEDERVVGALVELGARGFLRKDDVCENLADAVVRIAAGGAVLTPLATRWLIDWHSGCLASSPAPAPDLPDLTPREVDVLRLVAQGMSNAQIARTLVLGVSTVKSHLYHAMKKLGISDRAKAVAMAYQYGLVKPSATVRLINDHGPKKPDRPTLLPKVTQTRGGTRSA